MTDTSVDLVRYSLDDQVAVLHVDDGKANALSHQMIGAINAQLDQAETNEIYGKTKVLAVLESLPGVGKVKARRAMEDVGIAETRRLRGLGKEQRAKLLDMF